MADSERLKIVDADRMHGDILIHFSNNMAVHYHAQFLWDVREQDGNVALDEAALRDDDEATG